MPVSTMTKHQFAMALRRSCEPTKLLPPYAICMHAGVFDNNSFRVATPRATRQQLSINHWQVELGYHGQSVDEISNRVIVH